MPRQSAKFTFKGNKRSLNRVEFTVPHEVASQTVTITKTGPRGSMRKHHTEINQRRPDASKE